MCRIPDWLRLEGTSVGHLVQALLIKKGHLDLAAQDQLEMSFEYLKHGGSTASLGYLCWYSITLRVKKCFLVFRGNLLCYSSPG